MADFTLEHCKQMFVYLNHEMANLMGGQFGEGCAGTVAESEIDVAVYTGH